jgi:hypothetical protein
MVNVFPKGHVLETSSLVQYCGEAEVGPLRGD